MCLSPITIPNPNYGHPFIPGDPFSLKDCTSKYISINCGHCSECIASKQMQLVQRVQMESLKNHLFFATLTYNTESLPTITTSSGYTLRYADPADLQKCFKRLRKSEAFGRPFRYLAVSELGTKKGRPHFHVLFFIPKQDGDDYNTCLTLQDTMWKALLKEWRRNYGSTRAPVYRPLCTYIAKFYGGKLHTNYDLHYVNPRLGGSVDSGASVAFYVLKYMMKRSDRETKLQQALRLNLSPDEYEDTWNIVHTRYFASLGFGLPEDEDVIKYIRSCVKKSISTSDYPLFFNPDTGQSFPLSRYYKSKGKLYSYEDALSFYFKKSTDRLDSSEHSEQDEYTRLIFKVNDYEKKRKKLDHDGDFADVDLLYDM